jgi:hypothetical protein
MMASHRPADTPAPPPEAPPPTPHPAAPTAPGGLTTLPASGFLVGFDWVLAFGVLALAFLTASFAARNSDLWLHLAGGRLLANGQYHFGTDPFSYVGGDRTWVNHAWLFDWLAYQLYRLGAGPGLVIAKAVAVALTAGLLLLARKPGQPVFPGVVCAGLGLLAAAPWLGLDPALATLLGLAALLFLIIRVPRRPGSWTFPLLVAGLFWAWANCDQWFILGPGVLLLYTLGQYARADEGEDPGTLWKALGLGILACTLNPHHVRVWALPPEAFDRRLAEMFAGDVEYARLFRGGLAKEAWDFDANPVNPAALILLLALTAAGFLLNRRQASFGLGLVALGALGLAYLHLRAVPFLAVVLAPVAAVNLAAVGRRLADRPMPEGTVRALHALRSGGRAAVGLVGLLLVALTYAGWTQPFAQQRRWKWDVEPSQSLIRAAERVQRWRTEGTLPPEARLLNLQPDFANYVAWFAPSEKTFFDYRLAFHRPEAAEYVALRKYLAPRLDPQERKKDPYDLAGFLRKYNVTYAVSAHPNRGWNQAAVDALWADGPDQAGGPDWVLWNVEGRAVILGWTRQEAIPPSAFDRLRFDPVRAAFGEATPLARPEVRPPLPPRDVWERFVQPPPVPPAEAEEAFVLMRYRQSLMMRIVARHRMLLDGALVLARDQLLTPALTVWTLVNRQIPPTMPPEVNAAALLAVRAGRKAVATSPDHPDGYYFLAKAYMDSSYYVFPDLQAIVTTVNLTRCRARLPEDVSVRRATIDVLDLCEQLDRAHDSATPRRLDLRLEVTRLGVAYLRDQVDFLESERDRATGDARERLDKELEARRKGLDMEEQRLKEGEDELRKSTDKYINAATGSLFVPPLNRAALARQFGLHREAIRELRRAHEKFQKELGEDKKKFSPDELAEQMAIHAELVELLMFDGEVEEASQILDSFDTPDTLALMRGDAVRRAYFVHRRQALTILNPQRPPFSRYDDDPAGQFRSLRQAVALSVGDFDQAIAAQAEDLQAVRRDLATFRAQNFPGGPPPPTLLPDATDLQLDLFLRPALTPLGAVPAMLGRMARAVHTAKVRQARDLARAEVENHLRLGLTYLEQGDVGSAARHFKLAQDAPEFKNPLPAQRQAKEYLRAIDRATGGRGAGE